MSVFHYRSAVKYLVRQIGYLFFLNGNEWVNKANICNLAYKKEFILRIFFSFFRRYEKKGFSETHLFS